MRSIIKLILAKTVGSLIFLLFLLLANIANAIISNNILDAIVSFLNSQILLIIAIAIVVVAADGFRMLTFPFNLPGPLFNGVAAVLSIIFLLGLLEVIISTILQAPELFSSIDQFSIFIYGITFLLTVGLGYLDLLNDRKK